MIPLNNAGISKPRNGIPLTIIIEKSGFKKRLDMA